eukprot:10492680-Alexandrium_andersonii.AAC.1
MMNYGLQPQKAHTTSATHSHRQPKTAPDNHRQPQTTTDDHKQPQTATDNHRHQQTAWAGMLLIFARRAGAEARTCW